jgi:hypothetical protein
MWGSCDPLCLGSRCSSRSATLGPLGCNSSSRAPPITSRYHESKLNRPQLGQLRRTSRLAGWPRRRGTSRGRRGRRLRQYLLPPRFQAIMRRSDRPRRSDRDASRWGARGSSGLPPGWRLVVLPPPQRHAVRRQPNQHSHGKAPSPATATTALGETRRCQGGLPCRHLTTA